MSYSKVSLLSVFFACLVSTAVSADGVFLGAQHATHELNPAESKNIDMEFIKKFGVSDSDATSRSTNPWQAKKERKGAVQQNVVSWGECRDYALQKRNDCYKGGKQAYYCERFYEARSKKCNEDY